MAGGKIVKEYCPECDFMVEPFVQDNVGFCPWCHGTTKDLVNEVQTGPDFMDAPEVKPKGKLVKYWRKAQYDDPQAMSWAVGQGTHKAAKAK